MHLTTYLIFIFFLEEDIKIHATVCFLRTLVIGYLANCGIPGRYFSTIKPWFMTLLSMTNWHHHHSALENGWDVYIELLIAQGKRYKALEVLRGIQCMLDKRYDDGDGAMVVVASLEDGNGGKKTAAVALGIVIILPPSPSINKKSSVSNHIGLMLP